MHTMQARGLSTPTLARAPRTLAARTHLLPAKNGFRDNAARKTFDGRLKRVLIEASHSFELMEMN